VPFLVSHDLSPTASFLLGLHLARNDTHPLSEWGSNAGCNLEFEDLSCTCSQEIIIFFCSEVSKGQYGGNNVSKICLTDSLPQAA
jgi:hypothetical protein